MSDIIRVIRIIEYLGERSEVERTLARSVEGKYVITDKLTINVTTINSLPELPKNQGDSQHEE